MAKPYPEWISGSPTDFPTIPGSAATFAICLTPEKIDFNFSNSNKIYHENIITWQKSSNHSWSACISQFIEHQFFQFIIDVKNAFNIHVGLKTLFDSPRMR